MTAINVPRRTTDLADVSAIAPTSGQVQAYDAGVAKYTPTQLFDVVNAASFPGVDPTGSTDSTAGLQTAIAAAAAGAGGKAVLLPPGTYVISNSGSGHSYALDVTSGVVIRGSGPGTVVRLASGQITWTRGFNVASRSNVLIEDLTYDGNTAGNPNGETNACEQQAGFFVNASSDVIVRGVTVQNTSGDGIYWYGGAVRCSVDGCRFDNIQRVGVNVQSATDCLVNGSYFKNNASNNHIKAELDNAGQGGSGLAIVGNIFDGISAVGIGISGYATFVAGTVTLANGSAAVVGSGTTFTTLPVGATLVFSNDTTGSVYVVRHVQDNTHLTLTANYSGPSGSGIVTEYENLWKDITVTGNVFTNLVIGINVGYYTRNWAITGNTFDDVSSPVAVNTYGTPLGFTARRNVIFSNNTIAGNLVTSEPPVYLANTTGVVISGNVISGNLNQYGITVAHCDGVHISNNLVGLAVSGGSAVTFYRSKHYVCNGLTVSNPGGSVCVSVQDDATYQSGPGLVTNVLATTAVTSYGVVTAIALSGTPVNVGIVVSPGTPTYGSTT